MENFEIPMNPEFSLQVRKFKTTDPAHADLFNEVVQALLNNDCFLRELASQMLAKMEQYASDSQTALDAYYRQSSGYTDTKIADLIGGAPTTLNTLGEIAQAMKDNESVVAALDAAVGKKANAAEFDSHAKDSTAHVTAAERNSWNSKADLGLLAGYLPLDGGTMRGNIVTTRLTPAADRRYTIGGYGKRYSDVWAVSVNADNVQSTDSLNLGGSNGPVYISPNAGDYINIIVDNVYDDDGNVSGVLYAGGKRNTEHKENWLGTPDCPWDNVFASKVNSKPVPGCRMSGNTLYIDF